MIDRKSKSLLKRQSEALRVLGKQLTELPHSQLEKIPMPEELFDAITQAKKIKAQVARKRHLQFIAKLMRSIEDITSIQVAYNAIVRNNNTSKVRLHVIEQWRDRLMSEDAQALTEFIQQYTCDDIQALRQSIRLAKKDQAQQKNRGGSKALFHIIRDIIQ